MQKHVNLVDLVKSFPTNIYLQNLASIQERTSPVKFAHLAEKSVKGSIPNLSTKAGPAYKIGQVVQVYSKSAKDWVDAKVISIENGLVAVNYSGPDGTMMSKTLRETDKYLRLKEQATSSSAIFLFSSRVAFKRQKKKRRSE